MDNQDKRREYRVQGRYGYWAIDLYKGDSLLRNVDCFRTRKQANLVCGELNEAYRTGLLERDESGN